MALEHNHNSKLMWIIVGSLAAIVSLAAFWLWYTAQLPSNSQENITSETLITPKQEQPVQTTTDIIKEEASINTNALVEEDILKDPIPQNLTLAQDEIAKLDDIQKQLAEKLNIIEAQKADADALIQLKEEQIRLLEEQLNTQT